jgi:hypothetical protein
MANLACLCSGCHAIYEQAARTLTLPVDTTDARQLKSRANGKRTPRRQDRHGAPFRGPTGQPWSREWFDY